MNPLVLVRILVIFVAAESWIFGDVANSLDVNDAFHSRAVGGDRHQIITLGDCWAGTWPTTKAAAAATTASEALRRTWRCLSRTKIDLTWLLAESSSSSTSTAGARTASGPCRLHALTERTHSSRVATLTHCLHRVAHVAHRSRIHPRQVAPRAGCVASGRTQ